jgi:hypothetical protein
MIYFSEILNYALISSNIFLMLIILNKKFTNYNKTIKCIVRINSLILNSYINNFYLLISLNFVFDFFLGLCVIDQLIMDIFIFSYSFNFLK